MLQIVDIDRIHDRLITSDDLVIVLDMVQVRTGNQERALPPIHPLADYLDQGRGQPLGDGRVIGTHHNGHQPELAQLALKEGQLDL